MSKLICNPGSVHSNPGEYCRFINDYRPTHVHFHPFAVALKFPAVHAVIAGTTMRQTPVTDKFPEVSLGDRPPPDNQGRQPLSCLNRR